MSKREHTISIDISDRTVKLDTFHARLKTLMNNWNGWKFEPSGICSFHCRMRHCYSHNVR